MKRILFAMLALAVMPAHAFFVEARLNSFDATDARVNGAAPAGGVGSFSLLTDVTGTDLDFLGANFFAQCIEHDESVSTGNTYRFNVVDLSQAPTSVGGMGVVRAGWIESIMVALGHSTMATVATAGDVEQSAIQMATYEVVGETSGQFDWDAGTVSVAGAGAAMTAAVSQHADQGFGGLDMFGLLNVGVVGASPTRSLYRAQDFMVFTASTVDAPEPAPLMLMGLGMLGLARKLKK